MRSFVPLVLMAATITACQAVAPTVPTPAATPVHWAYEGEAGPERWGELSADFAACATGVEQSPIDIADPAGADLANIDFAYLPVPLNILNNGHTVQVNYAPGSSITLDGVSYDLLQFHFHAPSEHHVSGQPAEAELHLVHRAADGRLAVVGAMLIEGPVNEALAPVFDSLPAEEGPERATGATIDAAAVLPATRTTYRYSGSLTTPPCSEGVAWLLLTAPIAASAGQLADLAGIIDGNNRPLQPLNGRDVAEDLTP